MGRLASCVFVLLTGLLAVPVEAQLNRGDFRFSIDVDMLSMAAIEDEPEIGAEQEYTVFGVGWNQVGGARETFSTPTPLGLGLGWVLNPKIVLGARLGLGLDVVDADGDDNSARILGISLMPGITFVPIGHKAKLFLQANPLFQVSRVKTDGAHDRYLLGGFGLGIGTLIFVSNDLSVDLGFHFEGRFGGREREVNGVDFENDVRDLRGVVRLGISLWN